jgi:signal transduction histidine kinase
MKRRILISLGLLLAICVLGDAAAMWCLWRSTHQLAAVAEAHRIQWLRANLASNGVRLELDLLSQLSGHPHPDQRREENVRRFTRSLNRCGSCHHPPSLTSEFESVGAVLTSYRATLDELYASSDAENQEVLEQNAIRLADRFVERTTEMADRADKHLFASSTAAANSVETAWAVLTGTLLILLAGGGSVALHLKGRLTEPVEALRESVERARKGETADGFPSHADEEFRVLATAFSEAYQDLTTAKESVLQAEKLAATGQLAAGVAHEVLNPLASISSIAQVMRRRCESEEQKEHIELIGTEITRVTKVLREVLLFSRPAAAEMRARVDIAPLLEHAATLIGYDHRARQVEIVRRVDPDLPPVRGDSQRLLLVFTNIMINALDAMSTAYNGAGTLAVSTHRNGQRVVLQFKDQGPGMEEEHVAHAFDPFFTTKEPGAGTGLGLWICHQVVQRHNGTIRIDSRLGEGTAVTIELPIDPQSHATDLE